VLVSDVLLDRGHTAVLLGEVGGRQPSKCGKEVPVRLVKFADVPHDVHVTDVVALPRIHGASVGDRAHGAVAVTLTRPATDLTLRGAASQMTMAETRLSTIDNKNAGR